MESKEQYDNYSPPSYSTAGSAPYTTTGAAYPAPATATAPYPPGPGAAAPYGQASPVYVESAPPQQPQVLVVRAADGQQPVIVQSYAGHIAFACVVFLCCNWVFGCIAFILASQYTVLLFYFVVVRPPGSGGSALKQGGAQLNPHSSLALRTRFGKMQQLFSL